MTPIPQGTNSREDPEKFAEALATVDYYERVLNNPLVVPNNPISEAGGKLKGKELAKAKEAVSTRAKETYSRYQGVDSDTRSAVVESLGREISSLEEGSARRLELEGMVAGLGVLSAVEDGDDFEGGVATQRLAQALAASGNIGLLMAVAPQTMGDALEHQQEIRSALGEVQDHQWAAAVGDASPASPIAELLAAGTGEGEDGQFLTEDDRAFLREVMQDQVMGDIAVLDPALQAQAPTAGSGRDLMKSRGISEATDKARKELEEALGSDELAGLLEGEDNQEERQGFWATLLNILTGNRKDIKETLEESKKDDSKGESKKDESKGADPKEDDDRKDGDTWKSGDLWYGKKDGETKSFDTEDGAKGFAKGASITPLARGYTFEVWGRVAPAGGQKSPFRHR